MISLYVPISDEIIDLPHLSEVWKGSVSHGDYVIFTDDAGQMEMATVLERPFDAINTIVREVDIVRRACGRDLETIYQNQERGKIAREVSQEFVQNQKLPMRMLRADYSFDQSMLNIMFFADKRVDFRELLRKLTAYFQVSVHLEQIGPRDKARLVWGIASCGQTLCCERFLTKLPSVSVDLIRKQNLMHRGTESLTGCCGKLKCCLRYEDYLYDGKEYFPKHGAVVSFIDTHGQTSEGIVLGNDIPGRRVRLRMRTGGEECYVSLDSVVSK